MTHTTDGRQDVPSLLFRSHTAHLLATALPFIRPSYRHPIELMYKFLEFSETLKLFQEFHIQSGSLFSSEAQETTPINREDGFFGLISTFITDLEGLLGCLSKVCTGDEREIIGMFLNIVRAKNFYESYGDLLKMGSFFQADSDSQGSPDFFQNSNMGTVFSQLFQGMASAPPSKKETDSFAQDSSGTPSSDSAPTLEHASSPVTGGFPFSGDLTSMLNDDQKETLDLLKSLFSSE